MSTITSAQDEVSAAPGGRNRAVVDGKFFYRGGGRRRVRAVPYVRFALGDDGQPLPARVRVADDFARMRAAGINTIRTYHTPPGWLFDLAGEQGVSVLLDVPWPKHVCFLAG